ncbi:hypothetical protein [Dactylosporangium sp. NPDC051484]|uniref:hypothetical protein n=1 Tax=Dactylosporangium sp. NPDC051484 TaxID=3154942 RepID=UPI0034505BD9
MTDRGVSVEVLAQTTLGVAGVPVRPPLRPATGSLVELDGRPFYRIENHDAMEPFLMSVASSSDHWLFLASNGALTAGRRTPDLALFPYYTDDRIYESLDRTGGRTVLRVRRAGATQRWEPFSEHSAELYRVRRTLDKSLDGTTVRLTEVNEDLGLAFTQAWSTSERFGFVRDCTLTECTGEPVAVDILDGIQNLIPPGVDAVGQQRFSTIADGYKDNELHGRCGLATFRLSALPRDTAEPSESLRATAAWSRGLEPSAYLLSTTQLDLFRHGGAPRTEERIRGRRGAFLVVAEVLLAADATREWVVGADVGLDAAEVIALRQDLDAPDAIARVRADVARGAERLVAVLAGSDGLQCTADGLNTARHYSNTLYNVMRGGVPVHGYRIDSAEFAAYLRRASPAVALRHRDWLAQLPAVTTRDDLVAAAQQRDPALERLTLEYLPLRYSRRHGDPSRPWNTFSIAASEPETGHPATGYEGNWRDIFQNWEALAYSYPGYLDGMIAKFLDCSTADGYNPYHITQHGFAWQSLQPGESSLNVGYWGDHQVIYLLKLLEAESRFRPGRLESLLGRPVFAYANVPYRIKPYAALTADPHRSIDFDADLHQRLLLDRSALGTDALLLPGPDDAPLRVTLAEKLLLVALARLVNYVPGTGIWLNTQRPEWNDGNNALVGNGVSVVTLCYLRRYLTFLHDLIGATPPEATYPVSAQVAELARRVTATLTAATALIGPSISDTDRRRLLDELAEAGSDYRAELYKSGLSGTPEQFPAGELRDLCVVALRHVDNAIRANRRPDGLFHAYNVLRFTAGGVVICHLDLMLEGQVAALSAGLLTPAEAADVLDALRSSPLYREDQNSYLLHPDRDLPGFLDRGRLPAGVVEASPLLRHLLDRDDRTVVREAADGAVYFNGTFRNVRDLTAALDALSEPRLRELADTEADHLTRLYEQVFDHHSYTGRSGTFFKYEGLGCIYWHMVSKLRLAVQEVLARSADDPAAHARLSAHYEAICDGLGMHKSPDRHGAVPIDTYSHTPGFAGAQQPGMTGQVKEDILCRLGELGLTVAEGRLRFGTTTLRGNEFLSDGAEFGYVNLHGERRTVAVPPQSLAFTFCQVPVIVQRNGTPQIVITRTSGERETIPALILPPEPSAAIFTRNGEIAMLEVQLNGAPD